jgi:hypothetical protein
LPRIKEQKLTSGAASILKVSATLKEISKIKRQPTEWEKFLLTIQRIKDYYAEYTKN